MWLTKCTHKTVGPQSAGSGLAFCIAYVRQKARPDPITRDLTLSLALPLAHLLKDVRIAMMIPISVDFKMLTALKEALKSELFLLFMKEMEAGSEAKQEWVSRIERLLSKINACLEGIHFTEPKIDIDDGDIYLLMSALDIQIARLRVCLLWFPETADGMNVNDGGFLESVRTHMSDQLIENIRNA